MSAFKTQFTKVGMRKLCLQKMFSSEWANNSAITILHVFVAVSFQTSGFSALLEAPVKAKLVCQPNAISTFHLMSVRKSGLVGIADNYVSSSEMTIPGYIYYFINPD